MATVAFQPVIKYQDFKEWKEVIQAHTPPDPYIFSQQWFKDKGYTLGDGHVRDITRKGFLNGTFTYSL